MRANELTVGDWIYDTMDGNKNPVRISIDDFKDESEGIHPFSVFEPIPLTEKILEINEFEQIREDQWLNDYYQISVYERDDHFFVSLCGGRICSDYIHKLQHLLRDCGLYDFADNFRIEN